jgi:hypothetical protein
LDNLQWIAEIVEEDAKELQPDIPDTQLQRVSHECSSVLSDIQILAAQIQDGSSDNGDATNATRYMDVALGEKLDKARAKLLTLQIKLSQVRSKRIAHDADIIRAAVIQLLNSPNDVEDSSSIRTYYTASSIPYVERQMWREVERSLRLRFSTEFVRDHFSLIVATVEETLWNHTSPGPATSIGLLSTSKIRTTTEGDTVPTRGDDTLSLLDHEAPDASVHVVDSVTDKHDSVPEYHPDPQSAGINLERRSSSVIAIYNSENPQFDKTGKTWAESVDDPIEECLLTFGTFFYFVSCAER